MDRLVGVLAGDDLPDALLRRWTAEASWIVAADAGADALARVGVVPHVVVGDLDSIAAIPSGAEIRRDPDQGTTDCDKLLNYVRDIGVSQVTLINVEGSELDHVLASLHSAARSGLRVRLALRAGIGWIVRGGDHIELAATPGRRVSLLPLTPCRDAQLEGVLWPFRDAAMEPGGFSSISNVATEAVIRAGIGQGAALLVCHMPADDMPNWQTGWRDLGHG